MTFNEQIRELSGDREAQAKLVLEEAASAYALRFFPNEVQDIVVDSADKFMRKLEGGSDRSAG